MKSNNLIAIASGKGGVGKTWFSVNFSYALGLLGKRVLLVDADVGLANIDIQIGLTPKKDLGHVICGQALLEKIITPTPYNFDLIPGRSGSGLFANMNTVFLSKLINDIIELGKNYDYVIIDSEAGIGSLVKLLTQTSSSQIVVLNEEPTSLTDAYALIKSTKIFSPYIATTNVHSNDQGKNVFDALAKATSKFMGISPTYLGSILKDEKIPHSIRLQSPSLKNFPETLSSQSIKKIAKDFNQMHSSKYQEIKNG